jgi:PKHD-type hydroxylase
MFLRLADLLDPKQLGALTDALADAEFVSGALTAHGNAARVKNNLQLVRRSAVALRARELVLSALMQNAEFVHAVCPKVVLPPLFCRYEPGMSYGLHRDTPLAGDQPKVRTDVSMTVFLNDATEYDGGELVLHAEDGPRSLRGAAGEAIIYASGVLHEVTPVTRGVRLVAVSWAQSLVPSPDQRRVLRDLARTIDQLSTSGADAAAVERLSACRDALLRMWAQP